LRALARALPLALLLPACIDFRDGLACSTDADCDGYYCSSGKCVATRAGGGVASGFRVDSLPEHVKAGQQVTVQLSAIDASGHVVQNFTGQAALTSSDPHAHLPPNPTFTSGVTTAQVSFELVGNQTLTATQADKPSVTGSATTAVGPGDAASIVLAPATQTPNAGVPFRIDLTAKDAYGNVTTGYAGTVAFTTTDAQAQLAGNTSFTNGSASVNVTLKTAGTQSITARDVAASSITGAASVGVAGGAAASYKVTGPNTASAGTPITLTVTAQDPYGNTAALYGGAAGVTSTDGQATLPTTAFTAGVASGLSVTFRTAGAQSITFKDPGNAALTASASVSVSAGPVSTFVVSGMPASIAAGSALTFTATARDVGGNLVTTYAGTPALSSSDAQATFPQTTVTFSPGSGTVSGVQAVLKTAGAQTITLTDAASHASGSGAVSITPTTWGGKLAWTQQPTTVRIGAVMTPAPAVAFVDNFGNPTTVGGNVNYGTPGLGQISLDQTFSPSSTPTFSGGVVTFNGLTLSAPYARTGVKLVAVSQSAGQLSSAAFDLTSSWAVTELAGTNTYGAFVAGPDALYVTSAGVASLGTGGLRSTDGGLTWQAIGGGPADVCAGNTLAILGASRASPGTLLGLRNVPKTGGAGCTPGLLRSTDHGQTWTVLPDGAGTLPAPLANFTTRSITFGALATTPETLLVAWKDISNATGLRLLSSTDGGATFTDLSAAMPAPGVSSVCTGPLSLLADAASSTAYLTLSDGFNSGCQSPYGGAYWTSANAGTSWTAGPVTNISQSNSCTGAHFRGVRGPFAPAGGGLWLQPAAPCSPYTAADVLAYGTSGWQPVSASGLIQTPYATLSASSWLGAVYPSGTTGALQRLARTDDSGAHWDAQDTAGLPPVEAFLTTPSAWLALGASAVNPNTLVLVRLPKP
jgi:hypothetical protein